MNKINHEENINKKFNRLTLLSYYRTKKYIMYNCICDCGKLMTTHSFSILNNSTTSCGCYYDESRTMSRLKPRKDIMLDGASAANYVFLTYKRNAKLRELPFELSKPEFLNLTKKNCYYCNSQPKQKARCYGKKNSPYYFYNGVDRVDNKLGYTLDNSVPCCTVCNRAKGTLSKQEFFEWIQNLISYNEELCK